MNQLGPKMRVCPYDRLHVVREDRLAHHLLKCGKIHQNRGHVICPFNNTHVMLSEEYQAHEKTCLDKMAYEIQLDKADTRRFEDADGSCEEYKTRPVYRDELRGMNASKQRLINENDFFPMGVMEDDSLPPQVTYSKGRARLRLPKV